MLSSWNLGYVMEIQMGIIQMEMGNINGKILENCVISMAEDHFPKKSSSKLIL